jgi:hypothetical protein
MTWLHSPLELEAITGFGGSSLYQDFTGPGFRPLNFFGPGGFGGGGGGGGINIGIGVGRGGGGGGGGPRVPSVNQVLTEIVNSYERILSANLGEFQTGVKDGETAYNFATAKFDEMIQSLLQYGAQGENAAAERDRRRNPSLLKWDWILLYIDPINGGLPSAPPGPSIAPRVPRAGGGVPPIRTPYPSSSGFGQIDNTLLYLLLAAAAVLVLTK